MARLIAACARGEGEAFFDTVTFKASDGMDARARAKRINLRKLEGNRVAVSCDETMNDGEAQAEASGCYGVCSISLTKTLEHVRQELGGDAQAGIGHDDLSRAVPGSQIHADVPA